MSKLWFNSLLCSPVALGAALIASGNAAMAADVTVAEQAPSAPAEALIAAPEAGISPVFSSTVEAPVKVASTPVETSVSSMDTSSLEQVNRYSREGRNTQAQVTSVSQLSDVRPTDWAFQALQSLVERYGCIVGYPDRTYRGNQALTRYEFAAGLNACLDRINELIAAATGDLVKKEDLDTIRKLQEEFAAELATLRGRVDSLEARTTTLEKQQFSTTTKLSGEAIFAITDEFGRGGNNNTVFQDRVRLLLNTSFSGKDLLVTRLDAGNAELFNQPGNEGQQTFNIGNTGGNNVALGWLAYYFPIGEQGQVYIPAYAGLHYDYAPTSSGLMEGFDGGNGPLSVFAQRNPIYNIGGGTGIGVTLPLGPLKISAGYMADNSNLPNGVGGANVPTSGGGLFNGSYSALGQVTFAPGDALSVSLTYVNAYRKGGLGIFDIGGGASVVGTGFDSLPGLSTKVNAFGVSAALKPSPNFSINGFATYGRADFQGDLLGEAEFWSFGGGVAIADFGRKGSLLGIAGGIQPYLGNTNRFLGPFSTFFNKKPVHLEAFYKFQVNDFISITPGVIWILNPAQASFTNDVVIGTIRTTFTF